MPADRKGADVSFRIEQRRFDDPEVRAALEELDVDEVEFKLGTPRVVLVFAEGQGYWKQGDARPLLADDDPAVMQMIGRCLASRVRRHLPAPVVADNVHPTGCAWDEYPDEELAKACDWATWSSRYVVSEILVWSSRDDRGVTYEREGDRTGTYTNPRWRDWWSLPRQDRAARLEQMSLSLA